MRFRETNPGDYRGEIFSRSEATSPISPRGFEGTRVAFFEIGLAK